jgi:uncharacterized membrane protein YhiD involved in acid resistance
MNIEQAETLSKGLEKATYASASAGLIFGMSAEVFAAIASIVVAVIFGVISQVINWYWKHQNFKLEKLRFEYETGQKLERRSDSVPVNSDRRS